MQFEELLDELNRANDRRVFHWRNNQSTANKNR